MAGLLRAVSVARILRVTNCRGPTADTALGLQSREPILGFRSPALQSAVLQSSTPTALLCLSRAELRLPGCEDAGYRLRPRYPLRVYGRQLQAAEFPTEANATNYLT